MTDKHHLLVIGPGYTARAIMQRAAAKGFKLSVVARRAEVRDIFKAQQIDSYALDPIQNDWPTDVTHILSSVAPPRDADIDNPDPIIPIFSDRFSVMPDLQWLGYLSSTNVYGDRGGDWVSEESEVQPSLARGKRRVAAEKLWLNQGDDLGVKTHLFRLAGIYGPGRNALETLKKGTARRIIKEGQLFSRIHVRDIAQLVIAAALSDVKSGPINGADDLPAPPQDVISYAAALMGIDEPPAIPFDKADLNPMAKSFYTESKRVKSKRMQELEVTLHYPTYKSGLQALWQEMRKADEN